MKKVIFVYSDIEVGISIYKGESIEEAISTFLKYEEIPTNATTLHGLLMVIKDWFSEMPFMITIIADGEIIYQGDDVKIVDLTKN